MARQGKGVIVKVLTNFINSLRPRQFKGKLVGEDYCGNKYYEIPPERSERRKLSRYYIPKGGDESRFDEPIPPEWESWIRFRRKIPPTKEEMEQNLLKIAEIKEKARIIDEKFKPAIEEQQVREVSGGGFPIYDEYEDHPGVPKRKVK